MRRRPGTRFPGLIGRLMAALALAGLVTACGSSSTPTTSSGGSPSTSGSATTIGTASGAMGTYLTDGSGRALYLFTSDSATTSTCTGGCATTWPPVTSAGTPAVSGSANAGLLGSLTRGDGTHQITYSGHPLYYFSGDSAAGQTNGQGINSFGAVWWLVDPAGSAITGTASPTASPSSGY